MKKITGALLVLLAAFTCDAETCYYVGFTNGSKDGEKYAAITSGKFTLDDKTINKKCVDESSYALQTSIYRQLEAADDLPVKASTYSFQYTIVFVYKDADKADEKYLEKKAYYKREDYNIYHLNSHYNPSKRD